MASILRLLVLTTCVVLGLSSPPGQASWFWLAACTYGSWVIVPMVLGIGGRVRGCFGGCVFLIDILALSTMIVLRGHEMQGLLVAIFTLMLLAAVVEGVGNLFVNVAVVSGAYVTLTRWGTPTDQLLSSSNLAQLALFFVVAVLMTHAAQQARQQSAAHRHVERRRRQVQHTLLSTSEQLRTRDEQLAVAQESLRANERLVTLGMLSAGVNHELRSPITVLVAAVGAAVEITSEMRIEPPSAPPEELDDALAECGTACEHLGRIVGDLNNLARAGEVRTGEVDPAVTVDAAARMLERLTGPGIDLRVETARCRTALADPGRLLQVLLNLGKNAIDAMQETGGGELLLACADAGEGDIALVVADTGPGIPDEIREHMFEPFMTTKPPGSGTGLGLHLVGEIVTSHGGSIVCDSAPGEGTRFTVRLPGAVAA